jgi:hypothetical protein
VRRIAVAQPDLYLKVVKTETGSRRPAHAAANQSVAGESIAAGAVLVRIPRVTMQMLRVKAFLAALIFSLCALVSVQARDDGRYANDPLKYWFDHLASGKGACCSFADGVSIQDVDWDTQDGKYRVRLYGEWIIVPDSAVVTEPNKFGPAVVWPYMDAKGVTQIRCFLPGAGT